MPKAKRAPAASTPGRTDRVFLASLSVLLALATGWLIYAESSPEHAGYQRSFREAVRQQSGDAAAATTPTGIQQVWIPQAGDANRCVTCHLAVTCRRDPPLTPRGAVRVHAVPWRSGMGGG
jgi:hypothetical protein